MEADPRQLRVTLKSHHGAVTGCGLLWYLAPVPSLYFSFCLPIHLWSLFSLPHCTSMCACFCLFIYLFSHFPLSHCTSLSVLTSASLFSTSTYALLESRTIFIFFCAVLYLYLSVYQTFRLYYLCLSTFIYIFLSFCIYLFFISHAYSLLCLSTSSRIVMV